MSTALKQTRPAFVLAFTIIIFLAFYLRIYELNTLAPGLHYDESRNLIRAWRVSQGYGVGWVLDDIPEPFEAYGRGIYFIFAGPTIFSARTLTVFLHLIAVAAVIGAARVLYWHSPYRDGIALTAGLTLATIPSATIFGRTLLRTNWVPAMSMVALMMLVWAWRTRKTHYYALAGIFTALAAMFYLSGLVYPPIIALLTLLTFIMHPYTWPGLRKLAIMGIATLITFLPWLYFYIRIPHWLSYRAGPSEYEAARSNPTLIFRNLKIILETLYIPIQGYPEVGYHFAARYNAFRAPFLNPPLLMLFLAGVVLCIWRWRRIGGLVPLIIGTGIIIPAAITADPRITSRLVPWFPALALIVGSGAGLVFNLIPARARPAAWLALGVLSIYSGVYTYQAVTYHFHDEPTLFDHPTDPTGIDWNYHIRLRELMAYVADANHPVYFPHNLLNYPTTTAYSRPVDFPAVHGYDGRPLPAGEIILPTDLTYNSPDVNRPSSYVLALPNKGEMTILPPFTTFDEWQELENRIRTSGEAIEDDKGWLLGYRLLVSETDNPLNNIQPLPAADTPPLAVFEDNLELVELIAPHNITPGEWVPLTLYWRLHNTTDTDYYVYLHLVENEVNRRGGQDDYFSGIHRWFFPTVMWAPGEIVPEVRWLYVFPDAPPGGYRFAITVHKFPGPKTVSFTNRHGAKEREGALIAGQTMILSTPFPMPDASAIATDAVLGDIIHLTHTKVEPSLAMLKPGDSLTVTLFWEAIAPPAFDYTLFLHLFDGEGSFIAQRDTPLIEERFPTSTWYAGAHVVTTHTLVVPQHSTGPYKLNIGMYLWPSLVRLQATRAGTPLPENVVTLETARRLIGG